ncbi:MAG: beta-lactamase family protein [Bacillus sp. (in: Bacteria)]|nr:beta-lactamase family protein [Bacillus sp. (in: firmicutes)]
MNHLQEEIHKKTTEINFSGVIFGKKEKENMFQLAYGFANRADELENKATTRFGIASGCKLFTAIAICQLVEQRLISFDTRLKDCLRFNFPNFSDEVTVHHLLTHSSGVPDYFDEAVMDDFEELWQERPMYLIKTLGDFLPMFQEREMMFSPGERFHYNNGGYILLGLIIEEISGLTFQDYVEKNIFGPCGMVDCGYFTFDQLPKNTAFGYIDDTETGEWRTNIYSLPVRGGSDGGAYVTAPDMMKLWDGLMENNLLSKEMTNLLLTPHIHVEEDAYYGYGVWISKRQEAIYKYHVMGYDPGVSFASSYYPETKVKLVIPSNKSYGPHNMTKIIEEFIEK